MKKPGSGEDSTFCTVVLNVRGLAMAKLCHPLWNDYNRSLSKSGMLGTLLKETAITNFGTWALPYQGRGNEPDPRYVELEALLSRFALQRWSAVDLAREHCPFLWARRGSCHDLRLATKEYFQSVTDVCFDRGWSQNGPILTHFDKERVPHVKSSEEPTPICTFGFL